MIPLSEIFGSFFQICLYFLRQSDCLQICTGRACCMPVRPKVSFVVEDFFFKEENSKADWLEQKSRKHDWGSFSNLEIKWCPLNIWQHETSISTYWQNSILKWFWSDFLKTFGLFFPICSYFWYILTGSKLHW